MVKRVSETERNQLGWWEQSALNWMLARPNPDGTIGFGLSKGPAAREWYRYFQGMNLHHKARHLKSLMLSGKQYMVPTQWPEDYDPEFKPSKNRFDPDPTELPENREAVIKKFQELLASLGKGGDPFQAYVRSVPVGQIGRVSDFLNAQRSPENPQPDKPRYPYTD